MERMFSRADLRKLLVPLMVEQALAMTIGMADTVMVASCSEAAVSGVSLIDSVNAVFLWLFPALATGGGVVLAQYIGRGEEENARRSVGQLTLLLVGFSMMISVLFMLFRDELLVLLFGQIEPQVMAYARTYFTVSIISYPFLALYNVGASVFRAVGNSKLSMTVSTAANALNLIGNAILIYGVGLGVLGAGLATLASRILGAVIMLYKLLRPDCKVGMRSFGDLRFQKEMFGRILRIGIPSGLESAAFNIGKLLVASLVSTLVTAAITANAVMNTLQSIILIPTSAIHLAAVPIVGQCLGAGKAEDAKYYTKWLVGLAYICLFITAGGTLLFADPILSLFKLTPETTAVALRLLHCGDAVPAGLYHYPLPAGGGRCAVLPDWRDDRHVAGTHPVQPPVCFLRVGHYGRVGGHCGGLVHTHCLLSAAVPERPVAEEKSDITIEKTLTVRWGLSFDIIRGLFSRLCCSIFQISSG